MICRVLALVAACGLTFAAASAQSEPPHAEEFPAKAGLQGAEAYASIEFSFVPRQETVAPWSVRVDADRSGEYRAKNAAAPVAIRVSERTFHLLNAGDAAVNAQKCETRAKNIAQTGAKTLSYARGTALATCTFNYSDDDALNDVAKTFQAMVETLRLGDKLAHDKRFDHLGLNADLELLTDEAKSGRAIELQNIAPVLQSLAGNEDLMDVVRRKAQSLLQDASLGSAK